MTKKIKLGFSLIELSIVILVIGILVIGITKGSRIISEARLKSARSLTVSSPVASTSGLFLWLDSVSEKSFDTTIAEGDLISNWYDINPQSTSKINFAKSGSERPTYRSSSMNGLPSVEFGGAHNITSASSSFPYNNYSIFIVSKTTNLTTNNTFLVTYDVSNNDLRGTLVYVNSSGIPRVTHRSPLASSGGDQFLGSAGQILINKNYIISYIRNSDTSSSRHC